MQRKDMTGGPMAEAQGPIRLSTLALSPRESFDLWATILEESYDVLPNSPVPSLRSEMEVWPLEEAVYSKFSGESAFLRRTRVHAQGALSGYVKIRRILSGRMRVDDGQAVFEMRTGAIHVIDNSRPYRETGSSCRQQNAFIPAHQIGYETGKHPICISIPEDTPNGRILAAGFDNLFDGLERGSARRPSTDFILTIRALLTDDRECRNQGAFRQARSQAMRSFLQARLTKPGVGIDDLRHAFGASRSTIFRDFAEFGGIDAYVRDLRLEHAYLDLAESPKQRGEISRVAERFDFGSVASFSRKFRFKFGVPPTEVAGRFVHRHDVARAEPYGPSARHAAQMSAAESYRALYRRLQDVPAAHHGSGDS